MVISEGKKKRVDGMTVTVGNPNNSEFLWFPCKTVNMEVFISWKMCYIFLKLITVKQYLLDFILFCFVYFAFVFVFWQGFSV